MVHFGANCNRCKPNAEDELPMPARLASWLARLMNQIGLGLASEYVQSIHTVVNRILYSKQTYGMFDFIIEVAV